MILIEKVKNTLEGHDHVRMSYPLGTFFMFEPINGELCNAHVFRTLQEFVDFLSVGEQELRMVGSRI